MKYQAIPEGHRPDIDCPTCGTSLTGVMDTDEVVLPSDGDYGICMKCRSLSVFVVVNGVLAVRTPTDAELIEMVNDPTMGELLARMNHVDKRHGGMRD